MIETQPRVPFVPLRQDIRIFRNDNPWRRRFVPQTPNTNPDYIRRRQMRDFFDVATKAPATARMQVRLYEGATGAPIVLASSAATTGSRIVIDTWLYVEISASDLGALPPAPAVGEPLVLRYDLLINSPGIGENVAFYGDATIHDGVTR